jgi:hypothetical protein
MKAYLKVEKKLTTMLPKQTALANLKHNEVSKHLLSPLASSVSSSNLINLILVLEAVPTARLVTQ